MIHNRASKIIKILRQLKKQNTNIEMKKML